MVAQEAARFHLDLEAARDASQAVMAGLWVVVKAGRAPDNPEAWVVTAARNVAKNELRRRDRERRGIARLNPGAKSAEELADAVMARIVFDELLDGLPQRQREVLELRYGKDLAPARIAELMQVSVQTVKTHIRRGLGNIRLRLQTPEDGRAAN